MVLSVLSSHGMGTMPGEARRLLDSVLAMSSWPDECITWPYANIRGYGMVKFGGRARQVHRLVCESIHGTAKSPTLEAAHRCGNRSCFNPNHLRWATRSENEADKVLHGVAGRGGGPVPGERNGASKLTELSVRQIRHLVEGGASISNLAMEFSVDKKTVRDVVTRKTWKHLS